MPVGFLFLPAFSFVRINPLLGSFSFKFRRGIIRNQRRRFKVFFGLCRRMFHFCQACLVNRAAFFRRRKFFGLISLFHCPAGFYTRQCLCFFGAESDFVGAAVRNLSGLPYSSALQGFKFLAQFFDFPLQFGTAQLVGLLLVFACGFWRHAFIFIGFFAVFGHKPAFRTDSRDAFLVIFLKFFKRAFLSALFFHQPLFRRAAQTGSGQPQTFVAPVNLRSAAPFRLNGRNCADPARHFFQFGVFAAFESRSHAGRRHCRCRGFRRRAQPVFFFRRFFFLFALVFFFSVAAALSVLIGINPLFRTETD